MDQHVEQPPPSLLTSHFLNCCFLYKKKLPKALFIS
jgi:hypothetical protein